MRRGGAIGCTVGSSLPRRRSEGAGELAAQGVALLGPALRRAGGQRIDHFAQGANPGRAFWRRELDIAQYGGAIFGRQLTPFGRCVEFLVALVVLLTVRGRDLGEKTGGTLFFFGQAFDQVAT
jgi:hypothetical protein